MTASLRELLTSPTCDLPRKRDSSVSFVDQLGQMHADYVSLLKTTDQRNEVCKQALSEVPLINNVSIEIRSAVKSYLGGSPFRASSALRRGLAMLQPHLEMLVAPAQELSNLYRVREIDTLANSERKDIFHVPFHLRHRVN